MRSETILIVDDSHDMLEVLQRNLQALKFHTYQADNVTSAIEILKDSKVDLLITDLQMPKVNGMVLINYVNQQYPDIPILVITGFPSVSGAVEVIKAGAIDYLTKPFTAEELSTSVSKSLTVRRANAKPELEKSNQRGNLLSKYGIIGNSEVMSDLSQIVDRINDNRVTVLIQGESGTGKELIARAIHYSGKYGKFPFVAVNCGAIPENLLESELFGFVKGAFTGANEARAGFFQAADEGTIFLDEIGNASEAVQTRLLRVLQEKEITMIGATKPQKINVRVISATNSDLMALVKKGQFREDLYYRLNVISIETPPLRKRRDDIPLLVRFFLRKYIDEFDRQNIKISEKALEVLMQHQWPGNVRELENIVQRAVIMCDEWIGPEHLPDYLKAQDVTEEHDGELKTLKDVELQHIQKVLKAVGDNKTKAAEILGIDRKTLRQKLS
ncbi:MAG: sigma-54 dependent transcriptional regulator [Flavobacteriales bacterium]